MSTEILGYPRGQSLGFLGFPLGTELPAEPPFVEDLLLWLDATDEDTLYIVSNEVAQWNDKSGNGNHASTNSTRPDWNQRKLNGKYVVDFQGSDPLYTPLVDTAKAYTVFAVGVPDSIGDGGAGARTLVASQATEKFIMLNAGYFFYAGSFADATGIEPEVGRPFVFGVSWDGAVASFAIGNFRADIANTGSTPAGYVIIGARAGPIQTWDGGIGEILYYNRALNRTELDAVASYQMNRWGVSA